MKMKLAIVTPSFNGARFLREAIESVLLQEGAFDLHYHVQDGGSSDDTVKILEEYESRIDKGEFTRPSGSLKFTWVSEKDSGMYDAINRGFIRAEGEVLAWINSDDRYSAGVFQVMANVFSQLPEVEWLKGMTEYIDERSHVISEGNCFLYDQTWLRKGIYGNEAYFVEQDSVFWRRSLWEKSKGIDPSLRLAGDFELWFNFSRFARLYSIPYRASSFRKVEGQLSQDLTRYRSEMVKAMGGTRTPHPFIRLFFRFALRFRVMFFQFLYAVLFRKKHFFVELSGRNPSLRATRRFSIPVALR